MIQATKHIQLPFPEHVKIYAKSSALKTTDLNRSGFKKDPLLFPELALMHRDEEKAA